MEKNCGIFVIKKLYFVNFLGFLGLDFTLKSVWTTVGIGQSFKNSEPDPDRKK